MRVIESCVWLLGVAASVRDEQPPPERAASAVWHGLAVGGALVRGEAGTAAAVSAAGPAVYEGEARVPAGHRRWPHGPSKGALAAGCPARSS